MSDLFGNHIVGFPTRWLIYKVLSDENQVIFAKLANLIAALLTYYHDIIECFY